MICRVWDRINDRMIYQKHNNLLAVRGNSYWLLEGGLDDVRLIETQQNCGIIMYNTCYKDFKGKFIYEYDVLRRDFYSFSDDFVFDTQYAIVFYKEGWRIGIENGSELNLTQVEEGRDFRVRSYIVGNVYEGYYEANVYPRVKKFWGKDLPHLLALNIFSNNP